MIELKLLKTLILIHTSNNSNILYFCTNIIFFIKVIVQNLYKSWILKHFFQEKDTWVSAINCEVKILRNVAKSLTNTYLSGLIQTFRISGKFPRSFVRINLNLHYSLLHTIVQNPFVVRAGNLKGLLRRFVKLRFKGNVRKST